MKAITRQARPPQGQGQPPTNTAFGSDWAGISPTEVVIGQTVGLTGPLGEVARDIVLGTQALVQAVNDSGGVHGRQLRLLTLDDGHDPARIERNLRQLVLGDEVFALLNLTGGARAVEACSVPCVGSGAGESFHLNRSMWQVLRAGAGRSADASAQAWQLWLAYQVDMRRLGAFRVAPASLEAYLNARLLADAMRLCGPSLSRPGLIAALPSVTDGIPRAQVADTQRLPQTPSLTGSPTSFGL